MPVGIFEKIRSSVTENTYNSLTLSPLNKSSSAKVLVCYSFQSASKSPKIGENVVEVSNSLDLGETPSYSASHPDPSCLHMVLGCAWWAKG